MLGLWQEIWKDAFVKLGLPYHTTLQELFTSRIERSMKKGEESSGFFVQDLASLVIERTMDGHAFYDCFNVRHLL